ncbi:MAG TPA: hypothetical protein VHL30_03740 [Chlamydiales bacterium]|jgi:hypothetical protein|nr:hypothetical protein [Chlamydiales bacterium]
MRSIRFLQILTIAGALLTTSSSILFFKQGRPPLLPPDSDSTILASNTYFGPTKPIPGTPQLVRVEVLVRDSDDPSGPQIVSVDFNKNNVPLQPRDIYGNRGSGSFQLSPGKYKLRWVTNQNKEAWPRTITHEEEVTISPRDLWIQIQIEGDKASIH